MDLLLSDTGKLFRKYLFASVGSALVMSIYSFVDTIAVGQSEGAAGAAAMAVITPLYGLIVFLAILCGIGGSVLMSAARGEANTEKADACFTISVGVMLLLTFAAWVLFAVFKEWIFTFFGADARIMPKVMEYAQWIIWFFPVFIAPIFLGAFLRNDGAPGLATAAVAIGGCLNLFGDWYLVFPLGMGMKGAAIATVTGTTLQVLIMCSHFFSNKCRLRFARPFHIWNGVKKLFSIGFGASVLELGTVVIAVMMNNQVMRYGGTVELAIYGVIASTGSLFQALLSGVGQAIQPLISVNHGADRHDRVDAFLKMSLYTSFAFGLLFTCMGELAPVPLVCLFVKATPEIIAAAPNIVRLYFIIYLPLSITVLSTYYLQSVMRDKLSMLIALLRSIVLSALTILLLPIFLDKNGVWLALPCSECMVAILALVFIKNAQTHNE